MRPQENLSMLGALVSTGVVLCVLFWSGAGPASATPSGAISFENADIQTVVKQVAALTGITFLFDPEQVRGKITLLSPKGVSSTEALDLLRSALALHGYSLLSRAEATWIVPADRVPSEVFTIKVVPLDFEEWVPAHRGARTDRRRHRGRDSPQTGAYAASRP
jgi:type II secretory pathway component GspD/PulD (secretin)